MQENLSKVLFWDVNQNTIDFTKNSAFIVERVLSIGTMDDFVIIKNLYGLRKLRQIAKNLRYMDMRTMHFCSIYFKIKLTDLRCYKLRQLNPTPWNY